MEKIQLLKNNINKIYKWINPTPCERRLSKLDKAHKLGEKYFYKKKYERAEKMFREEINLDPEWPLGYQWLGRALLYLEEFDGAISRYETAIKKMQELRQRDPFDPEYKRGLKVLCEEFKTLKDVIRQVQEEDANSK